MNNEQTNMDYRVLLAAEFARRQSVNPRYSLRSFARSLGISVTTLSRVLNNKRHLSPDSAARIAETMFRSDSDARERFLLALYHTKGSAQNSQKRPFADIDVDCFRIIADWYHMAILTLAELKPNNRDCRWIGQRLGITSREAQGAYERLTSLGLIAPESDGEGFVRTSKPMRVNPKQASAAVRCYHHQNLNLAEQSLQGVSYEKRDFSAVTMKLDPSKIDAARRLIQKFREDFSSLMESSTRERDGGAEIYTMAIQLFPITKEKAP